MRKFSIRVDEVIQEFCACYERITLSQLVGKSLVFLRQRVFSGELPVTKYQIRHRCDKEMTSVYLTNEEYYIMFNMSLKFNCSRAKIVHIACYEYIHYLVGGEYFGILFKTPSKSN